MASQNKKFNNETVSIDKVISTRKLLAKILLENRRNNFPNIDRSPSAIFKRSVINKRVQAENLLSHNKVAKPGTLEYKCFYHWVEGNISNDQHFELIKMKYSEH